MGTEQTLAPLVRKLAARVSLSTADRAAILDLPARVKHLGKDAYLAREGTRADHCALLLSGMAYAQKWTGAGAKQILSLHLAGDLIAVSPALLPVSDHDSRALNPIAVAEIPRDALTDLLRRHPTIIQAFWLEAMAEASIHREWIVNVGRRNARQRIAHLLCELAYRSEANGIGPRGLFEAPLTQDHIADSIGATPVHVNRTLKAMRAEGLIRATRQAISIPDLPALEKAGEFNATYLHLPNRDA